MHSLILLAMSMLFLFFGNRLADALSTLHMPMYKMIFGDQLEKYDSFIRGMNRWGIRFGALVFLLMALATWFGLLEL